jgi:aspartyl-tRNA(Asn)/glutamyl-tRNA(Gln) amidotransferase subunit A
VSFGLSNTPYAFTSATEIADAFSRRKVTAREIVEAALRQIQNSSLNAFSDIVSERALRKADLLDHASSRNSDFGPLAGVPFAAKNLFDIAGITTRAGSRINLERQPATRDAALIERLEKKGAICVGALNMGEYAYDFTGENLHFGASLNPHDTTRITGGSSGGSAAAVAGGLIPLALGSDTNGSIRVPASYCGIFGLKPTYGRLSRARTFPFVSSFDHVGPFARNVNDLALAYDSLQGADEDDPHCAQRVPEIVQPELRRSKSDLKIAVAGGYFRDGLSADAQHAIEQVIKALNVTTEIELPEAARARAAAYVITAAEGGSLHRERLRAHATEFDPLIRDRLIAGALLPAAVVESAHKFRRWYQSQFLELFRLIDVIIAPATATVAPRLAKPGTELSDSDKAERARIGIYTQPLSFIGLPIVVVPIPLGSLPIGIQIIAAPWREVDAMRVAFALEKMGVATSVQPRFEKRE